MSNNNMIDNMIDNQYKSTPYKKSKHSSTSKSHKKSNHRHNYEEVLIRTVYNGILNKPEYSLHIGKRCSICGKISIVKYIITRKTEHGTYLMLDNNQILEMYPNLPVYDL